MSEVSSIKDNSWLADTSSSLLGPAAEVKRFHSDTRHWRGKLFFHGLILDVFIANAMIFELVLILEMEI